METKRTRDISIELELGETRASDTIDNRLGLPPSPADYRITDGTASIYERNDSIVVVLLGAPGSGKGTQCKQLSHRLNIPTISSGEILRRNIRKGTILGREASEAMNSGVLVHDELICKMLDCRTKEPDCVRGYILDGIPRTLNQAEFLELQLARVLARPFLPIVLSLEVDDETLLKRLCGRRICPICSSSYNIETKPPIIASICDFDGAILEMREDDREEVCLRRLGTYHTIASKMKDFYRSRYTVREINGNRPIHEIDLDLFTLILNSCRAAI